MRRTTGLGGSSVLGLGLLAALALSGSGANTAKKDAPSQAPPLGPDGAHDDETALARMLASETEDRGARIAVGWITVKRAQRSGKPIFDFLTLGKGYGHQEGDEHRHASTVKPPTAETRDLARRILRGELRPSIAIRKHSPGSWVELKKNNAERLITLQGEWGEGIYARIRGTRWYLYSSDTAPVSIAPYLGARERLEVIALVPALDAEVA